MIGWILYSGGRGASSLYLNGPRFFPIGFGLLPSASYWRVPAPNDWEAEW